MVTLRQMVSPFALLDNPFRENPSLHFFWRLYDLSNSHYLGNFDRFLRGLSLLLDTDIKHLDKALPGSVPLELSA